MGMRGFLSLLSLMTLFQLFASAALSSAFAESAAQTYSLDEIVQLALARNPVVSSAEGQIDQQRGQHTAAGAYPNPTVIGNGGIGDLKDTDPSDIGPLSARSITEYNTTVGQPIEWPSMRAASIRSDGTV